MPIIEKITAREILDSRGNPTIEVDVFLEDGTLGRASVPSGASTGEYEAVEIRDNNSQRYFGKGVLKAVQNVQEVIAPELVGYDSQEQAFIDQLMLKIDGTENKSKLGTNAILGVSLSVARATANFFGMELYHYLGGINTKQLPVPMMNILNGGVHADNAIDIQEFLIMPVRAPSFNEALRMGTEVFHSLKKLLKEKKMNTNIGDEGGFAPSLPSNEVAIQVILEAIEKAGYKPAKDIFMAIDVAASELYDKEKKTYHLTSEKKTFTVDEMISFYKELSKKYPITSIEDGLDQNDWDGWKKLTQALGTNTQLVGDDIFVTNPKRLKKGIDTGIANSILIKLNQIGTLTETLETVEIAHKAGYTCVISHRSGETEDPFISDLAVATGAGQIKTGSASRSERTAKYNQLIRIEEHLGNVATYKGKSVFHNL